ncbi:hypothetical protein HaLaN_27116, partial [Haematococcus lacustris]
QSTQPDTPSSGVNRHFSRTGKADGIAWTAAGMLLCKPVFSGKIKEAIADDKLVHKFLRDEWVATINSSVRSYRHDQFLSDRYNIDYNQPLGTGLFAVVLRAEERSTKASSMTRELARKAGC